MPKIFSVIRGTWNEFSEDDCGTLAAALAYYTVFSLPAALLIVVRIAGAVLGESAATGQIHAQLAGSVGPQVADQVGTLIANAGKSTTGSALAVAFGILGLLWSASNVTSQLQTALNRTWGVRRRDEGFGAVLLKRLFSFVLIVSIGLLVLLALAAGASGTAFAASVGFPAWLVNAADAIVSFVIFVFLFGAVYKVLPDARIHWDDVKAGAIFTTLLFVIGKVLVGVYIGHSGVGSAYGVAGSLALLLLWAYYSSMIFLLGAEFTHVWADREGKRIEPDEHAVRVDERQPGKAA